MSVEKTLLRDATILFSAENIPSLPIWKNQFLSKKNKFFHHENPNFVRVQRRNCLISILQQINWKVVSKKVQIQSRAFLQFCQFAKIVQLAKICKKNARSWWLIFPPYRETYKK